MPATGRTPDPSRQIALGLTVAGLLLPFALLGALLTGAATWGILTEPPADGGSLLVTPGTPKTVIGLILLWWCLPIGVPASFGALFARYGRAAARAAGSTPAARAGDVLLWCHTGMLVLSVASGLAAMARASLEATS